MSIIRVLIPGDGIFFLRRNGNLTRKIELAERFESRDDAHGSADYLRERAEYDLFRDWDDIKIEVFSTQSACA